MVDRSKICLSIQPINDRNDFFCIAADNGVDGASPLKLGMWSIQPKTHFLRRVVVIKTAYDVVQGSKYHLRPGLRRMRSGLPSVNGRR